MSSWLKSSGFSAVMTLFDLISAIAVSLLQYKFSPPAGIPPQFDDC